MSLSTRLIEEGWKEITDWKKNTTPKGSYSKMID